MPFAQWLQCKMEQHNFSNYRIAKMAGVHQSTVSNWLAGSKPQAEKEKLVRKAISDYEKGFFSEAEREKQGIKKDLPQMGEISKEALIAATENTDDMDTLYAILDVVNKKIQAKVRGEK